MPPKLDQGISASRAGSAQKRPPQTARRGRPLGVPRPAAARRSNAADDSNASTATTRAAAAPRRANAKAKGKQKAPAPSEDERDSSSRADDSVSSQAGPGANAEWCVPDRILLDRTLHLYSISPLHFSGLPGSIRKVSPALFRLLRAELYQYVNLRLSDGLGFLEDANTLSNARDSSSGDLIPPARRRRTDLGKVGRVRIDFVKDEDFLDGFDGSRPASDLEDQYRPWIIEMELGLPVTRDGVGSSRAMAAEAQSAELCHIVFLPGRSGSDPNLDSHSYPLILTKAPSVALGGDQPLGTSSNAGRLILTHALDWLQKRFDCRISQGSGAMSIASMLRGPSLEALAEVVVKQTRMMSGAKRGRMRSAKQQQVDADVKPVEMSFAFPITIDDPSGPANGRAPSKMDGPAPELATITLTVPWDLCMQLVDGLSEDQPLLPALNHYLAAHTSIPLDRLELVRIGVAGVNVGAGQGSVRLKVSAVPSAAAQKEAGANAQQSKKSTLNEADRARAGIVVGFLRDLADGGR
ncbi:uncharacterized protein PFL1_03693 [Pseudozyma flocculosa PF-1]|uniref:Uncharacterized protein n=2 Tax=Pseudozyma flocculosa TaxID=84751 RepID=A0A5C3F5Y8_9BASI|nr:uncharacterized protein PFL1_03693 [Pseudozyma flocculosa PF-1]EPQ28892.1 hypothetical protein PFL1_03693 [Pseudozyma flocculosa PF-1]SPO38621.1 uncharacterized protein PSFLO_04100 [Pseudozyma flocculosa]